MPTMAEIAAYWNRSPCNSNHSLIDLDDDPLAYSEQITARKLRMEPHLAAFARFPEWRDKQVLDLGCGIGTESLLFARHGAWVTGLDISKASAYIATRRAGAEGLMHRASFGVWDMERELLPEDQGAYDLVWAWGSVQHTPNPPAALYHAAQALKPGGELRLMVYHRLSTKALRLWLQDGCPWSFDRAVAHGSEAQPNCPVTHTYTRRSVRRLVEGAGLVVESVAVDHIFPWRGDAYGRHVYVKGFPWRWVPGWLFRRLERIMGWHLMVTARREG